MLFGLVVAALIVGGTAAAWALWRRFDQQAEIGPLELVTAGIVLGTAFWIGASWMLALTHTFTPTALRALMGVAISVAVLVVWRTAPILRRQVPRRCASRALWILPVALWGTFALWRGAVLPPASHDALAYHLPRAVMIVRAGGFEHFPAADHRINEFPANYELLLAGVVAISGSDRLTEWVSTVMFIAFLVTAAALAIRWWSRKAAIPEVILATASTPILLLHSSADKNDLMAAVFALTAILWGARWYARGGIVPMTLLIASLVISGGTKPQAAGVLVGLAPFLVARAFREFRSGRLRLLHVAATGLLSLAFFAIGGAAPYVMLLTRAADAGAGSPVGWGDLSNLWQVPILTLLAPFSPSPHGVWVPWRSEYWFWPRYEIFFSNWGMLFSLIVLLLPVGIAASGREERDGARLERFAGGVTALLASLVLLPTEIRPVGFFSALARYLLFVVPVVVCWTIPPVVESIRRSRFRSLPAILIATLTSVFVLQAADLALNDRFAPLDYARYAASVPGTRMIWFEPNRAASVVDRMAGPHDTIAIAGSFDTWIHPAYGSELTRPVILLPPAASGREVPASAQWVIVDRSWNVMWGHPELTHMGRFWTYIGRGSPSEEDLRVYRDLLRDPHFHLVYRSARLNQAVFWRIGSTGSLEPPVWRGPR